MSNASNSHAEKTDSSPVKPKSAKHDMVDVAEDRENCELLHPALDACTAPFDVSGSHYETGLVGYYTDTNQLAKLAQTRHRRYLVCAAFFGVSAVLVAIIQLHWFHVLEPGHPPGMFAVIEALAAVVALIAVVVGLKAAFAHRWLLHRFKAEACRAAKFNLLLNGGQICDGGTLKSPEAFVKDLETMSNKHMPHSWVRRELNVFEFRKCQQVQIADEYIRQLRDYFIAKRIEVQRNYFKREMEARESRERWTVHLPAACFFISVAAALFHFLFELAIWKLNVELSIQKQILVGLLLCAACAPVIGAGIRTYRSAHEFGRNVNRYTSLYNHLGRLLEELLVEGKPAHELLETMWEAERALESEHRSWMRLMIEAEWFG